MASNGFKWPMMIVPCGCHISLSILYLMAFARISAFRICYGASTCCRDASESTHHTRRLWRRLLYIRRAKILAPLRWLDFQFAKHMRMFAFGCGLNRPMRMDQISSF